MKKKMSLKKKRWLIVAATVAVAFAGWLLLEPWGGEWVLIAVVVGSMVEWQIIRCPLCDRHMGWFDKDVCGFCAIEIKNGKKEEHG